MLQPEDLWILNIFIQMIHLLHPDDSFFQPDVAEPQHLAEKMNHLDEEDESFFQPDVAEPQHS